MKAKTVMVQGTASHAGKSVITAGLCRLFSRKGFSVAPFKSQNMSLNSFVTDDGSEIGRAQATQAESAGTPPLADMNPILLKPAADDRSQVMVMGKSEGHMNFEEYQAFRPRALEAAGASLERLMNSFDVVVIEGAGAAAEINFFRTEIVNMAVARLHDSPVLLVGNIDRGGVFSSLVGTLELLEPADRERIKGLIINRFRGNRSLLEDGLSFLEKKTGKPVLGVIPHIEGLLLDDEDSVSLEERCPARGGGDLKVCVPRLPRISNFTDLRPLEMEDGVNVSYARCADDFTGADAVVIPGSKASVEDLRFFKSNGMAGAVARLCADGVPVIGICGGYQMLGSVLADAGAFDSVAGEETGLGVLPALTEMEESKTLCRTDATVKNGGVVFAGIEGQEVSGYEIHMGRTRLENGVRSFLGKPDGSAEGAVSKSGNVYGTYLHGIFENDNLRGAFLSHLRNAKGAPDAKNTNFAARRQQQYDRLADTLEESLDMDKLMSIVFGDGR